MNVDREVIAVLENSTIKGNALALNGQLDRALYTKTNKVLEAAGGKWNRKARAHIFESDASEAIDQIILTGRVLNAKQELGAFYTPRDLAERVIRVAYIQPGMKVLEPSAGRGALAAPALLAGGRVDCVEIDPRSASILCSTAYNAVIEGDFLSQEPAEIYDRVVMNPPFAKQDDIRHVAHAFRFLKPGGRLVAIMSAGVRFRENSLAQAFRGLVHENRGTIEDLPEGAFKDSGTGVRTVIVVMDKA